MLESESEAFICGQTKEISVIEMTNKSSFPDLQKRTLAKSMFTLNENTSKDSNGTSYQGNTMHQKPVQQHMGKINSEDYNQRDSEEPSRQAVCTDLFTCICNTNSTANHKGVPPAALVLTS